jgi:hypothetical protein
VFIFSRIAQQPSVNPSNNKIFISFRPQFPMGVERIATDKSSSSGLNRQMANENSSKKKKKIEISLPFANPRLFKKQRRLTVDNDALASGTIKFHLAIPWQKKGDQLIRGGCLLNVLIQYVTFYAR